MPARATKRNGGGYRVTTPHGTKAKHTTQEKAESQVRLLNALDHGFVPTQQAAPRKKKGKKA